MAQSETAPKSSLASTLRGWPGAVVALLAFALIYALVTRAPDPKFSSGLSSNDRSGDVRALEPSSTASLITWQVFSQTGQLSYEIRTNDLQQYAEQRYATVTEPTIQIQDQQLRPWQIVASQGKVTQADLDTTKDDELELLGRVRVSQISPQGRNQGLRVETSSLRVYPKRKHAVTEQPVVVFHPRFITKSNGLDLDLQTGTLRFVRGDATRVVSKIFLHNNREDL